MIPAGLNDIIVLVSTTDAESDTNGTLIALNASTGGVLWQRQAVVPAPPLPAVAGKLEDEDATAEVVDTVGLRMVPAVDPRWGPCSP